MVGQLAYSLMPWRISGSISTSIAAKFSTPHRCRIWVAVAEKPHMGICGEPFMKRTTGLEVTVLRILSWTLMGGSFVIV